MLEQGLIKKGEKIYVQVDFTTSRDKFLILSASLIVNNRAVPLYFSLRNYPKKAGCFNQKKMEEAFLKGLKHCLSKRYEYVLVADRGFGNRRFMELCRAVGFDYVIRIEPNMKMRCKGKEGIAKEVLKKDQPYTVYFANWKLTNTVYRPSKQGKTWYVVSTINDLSHAQSSVIYANRFKIENCFQDLKSSGFDIEKSKIRNYSRYKRLLAICMVSHALLVLLGHFIVKKVPAFLKNSSLMASVILAYFQWGNGLTPYLVREKSLA